MPKIISFRLTGRTQFISHLDLLYFRNYRKGLVSSEVRKRSTAFEIVLNNWDSQGNKYLIDTQIPVWVLMDQTNFNSENYTG